MKTILLTMCLLLLPLSAYAKDVQFQWGESTGQVDGYRILWSATQGGPYDNLLIDTNSTETTCVVPLDNEIEYYLVCRAYNSYGASGNSNEVHWLYELPGVPSSLDWEALIREVFLKTGAKTLCLQFESKE